MPLTVVVRLLIISAFCAYWSVGRRQYRPRARWTHPEDDSARIAPRSQRKPEWVRRELIRFKALSPELGCRVIAEVFNRQFAHRHVSVSTSYVAYVLRRHHSEIASLRQALKHRVPHEGPVNRTWAMDLTGKAQRDGAQYLILGVLDHGSRALLTLSDLADKRSLTILRALIGVFRRYGVPRRIRIDNEACFVSRGLSLALNLLGVRLQRIQPHCPWQNGRIERLFGPLKRQLDRVCIVGAEDLRRKLVKFRLWYNHARPHQHLRGRTPAEAWDGRTKATGAMRRWCGWDGRLVGWYCSE